MPSIWNAPRRLVNAVSAGLARCFGIHYAALSDWQRVLWQLTLAVCLLNLAGSLHDLFSNGGTDVRIRIVGARLLWQGIDPYTWNASAEKPPTLQDPNQQYGGLSRCNYPPTLLLLYSGFCELPYLVQRGLWMALEWLALAGAVALGARLSRSRRARYLFVVSMLFLVAGSYLWRFHVERGQYYVFLALLLVGGIAWSWRRRRGHIGAGLLFGLAMALRPPIVLLLVPLWLQGARKTVWSAVTTAVVAVLLTLPLAGVQGWRHYVWLVGEWHQCVLDKNYFRDHYPLITRGTPPVDGYQPGVLPLRAVGLTLSDVLRTVSLHYPNLLSYPVAPALVKAIYLVVLAGLLALLWAGHRIRPLSPRQTWTAGVFLVLFTDYFLPVRTEYTDVLFCVLVPLVMPSLALPRRRWYLMLVALAWLPVVVAPGAYGWYWWLGTSAFRALVMLGLGALPLAAALRLRLGLWRWQRHARTARAGVVPGLSLYPAFGRMKAEG